MALAYFFLYLHDHGSTSHCFIFMYSILFYISTAIYISVCMP